MKYLRISNQRKVLRRRVGGIRTHQSYNAEWKEIDPSPLSAADSADRADRADPTNPTVRDRQRPPATARDRPRPSAGIRRRPLTLR